MFAKGVFMKKLRIVNPKRFYTFIGILIGALVSINIIGFHQISSSYVYSASVEGVEESFSVQVVRGDTLWSIAENYSSDMNIDTRVLIREIVRLNNLENMTIHPGQTLKIPNI